MRLTSPREHVTVEEEKKYHYKQDSNLKTLVFIKLNLNEYK